ncbi:MAG: family 10 glycosylhydrolase [Akkermansiaceae bacterium]|nr:family 10 glycosylhydrolase [Akkermansiaceae bacterium]NNM29729.1 family 10 glycosylhydrolase [Akkermansiaceae bacterium]
MVRWCVGLWLGMALAGWGQVYSPVREKVPMVPREFRGAWVACVYNIDWPSRKGLSAGAQQAELRRILDKMASLRMNAIIFQVRPHADAVYKSSHEPWSPWLTGSMGRSPGYDPLAYCIKEAHARGIEVHAWFNPFRALPNASMPVSSNHITRTHPSLIRRFKNYKWMDISQSYAHKRALSVILDVVKRYDVDGVHIDDYFYPYPDVGKDGRPKQVFPDGKSPAQRRGYVDGFVRSMYSSVKRTKPWVRVGISPFGIWKPGVPGGTEARISAYDHLAADSRKWLSNGWCDYLSPQLYWRINGPQSFSKLLSWWRSQGSRPVWPGIATSRISSKDDPGRPASEILNQVELSRRIGRNWVGHVHWSAKALMNNRGGVSTGLAKSAYREPALVPPMPWLSRSAPPAPQAAASAGANGTSVKWNRVREGAKYTVQARYGRSWTLSQVTGAGATGVTLPGAPDAIAVRAIDRFGTESSAVVLGRR